MPLADITHFEQALVAATGRVRLETLYADPGYDAEWVHVVGRDMLDVRTIIPAQIGRPTDKPPTGDYRRLISQRIHLTAHPRSLRAKGRADEKGTPRGIGSTHMVQAREARERTSSFRAGS